MGSKPVDALAAQGREAFARGDSKGSERAFRAALEQRQSGVLFEGLARALYLNGDFAGSIEAHQRAYSGYLAEGDALASARAARLLAWLHVNVYGDFAVSGGWLARVEAQLASAEPSDAEHGWVELMHASRQPHGPDREKRLRDVLETSRGQGDSDLRFAVLAGLGEAMAMTGRVEEGMGCFDEALAAACGGEISDLYVVESVFCGMFLACERVHDVTRAEEWLRAAGDLVRRRKMLAINPLCRAHYGGVLTAAGRWQEAEHELDEAARLFEDGYVAARAIVQVRLADLRLQQGRLEEAAVLLEGLDQLPDAARPLAALHLARGDLALARDVLERRVAQPALTMPWPIGTTQPPPAPVECGLLAMLVDVHLAVGEVESAWQVTQRILRLATTGGPAYVEGCGALAEGKVRAARDQPEATPCLHRAMDAFARAHMPTELARARLELAKVVATERPEVAVGEARAALAEFEDRGAVRDADSAALLLRSLGQPGRSGPRLKSPLTQREAEVLDLLGHGLSNPEIASRLFISRKTAEHHVGQILFKLGLRNRAEAAVRAARPAE